MTTLKWVEKNYTYEEILHTGPDTKRVERYATLEDGCTLQDICNELDSTPDKIYIDTVTYCGDYDDFGVSIYTSSIENVPELERYKAGRAILRDREKERIRKQKQDEKDRKELERLKKKFGEK